MTPPLGGEYFITQERNMAFDPGFKLSDTEWDDILTMINAEAELQGVSGFGAMLQLMQDGWGLITDKRLRDQLSLHQRHNKLKKQISDAESSVQVLKDLLGNLPADPGRPRPKV